jgi:hypothetical protein
MRATTQFYSWVVLFLASYRDLYCKNQIYGRQYNTFTYDTGK